MDIVILSLAMSVGIGFWSNNWGRNGWVWGIVSVVVSPILTAIVLLIAGRSPELRSQLAAEHAMRVKAYMTDNHD
jgi:hypothetical protein